MKKSFTILELIIVIVILGVLGTISIEILQKTFQNYLKNKTLNYLSLKTDLTLNKIAAKMHNRIKNSVIAVKCDTDDETSADYCLNYNNKSFIPISNLDPTSPINYPVVEWLYVSRFSKRGMWNSDSKSVKPGWSGFVDLKQTQQSANDEYTIITPDSNFTVVSDIDSEWLKQWGVVGYDDVFANKLDTLLFSGSDGRGDLDTVANSYGYYDNTATRVFQITPQNDETLKVKALTTSNSTTVYESYYVVRGAMAIVPVYNKSTNDYNLTLFFNYFPWNASNSSQRKSADGNSAHQMYLEGNRELLATHVTQFKFKEEGDLLRIYLCITSPDVKLSDYNLTICKEKVVF